MSLPPSHRSMIMSWRTCEGTACARSRERIRCDHNTAWHFYMQDVAWCDRLKSACSSMPLCNITFSTVLCLLFVSRCGRYYQCGPNHVFSYDFHFKRDVRVGVRSYEIWILVMMSLSKPLQAWALRHSLNVLPCEHRKAYI